MSGTILYDPKTLLYLRRLLDVRRNVSGPQLLNDIERAQLLLAHNRDRGFRGLELGDQFRFRFYRV